VRKTWLWGSVIIAAVLLVMFGVFWTSRSRTVQNQAGVVPTYEPIDNPQNYDECVRSGGKIREIYPPICIDKNDNRFVQPVEDPPHYSTDCKIAGCSGELCVDVNSKDVNSICLYNPKYDCYTKAICEKQTSGECGWTETEEFRGCVGGLNNNYAD